MAAIETPRRPPPFKLEELLARCVGNLNFAERVLNRFVDCFADDLDRLEQHLQLGEAEEMARVAHAMKGASANVAAHGLCEQVAGIEELARRRQLTEVSSRLALLRDEWSRVGASIAAIRANPSRQDGA